MACLSAMGRALSSVTMAKKKGRKGATQRRGHLRSMPTASESVTGDSLEDQPLIVELRHALRADHPMALLSTISSMLVVYDPRRQFAPGEDLPEGGLDGLIESFVGTDLAETTAALHVISALVPDDLARARIRRVLPARRQPMPPWIRELDRAEVTRTELMTETLGDGDNYLLEVRLRGGELISLIVYVDHNLGTVVKNAFVIAEGLDRVIARYEELIDETQSIQPVDPALARAQLVRAVEDGAEMVPPLQTDDWPQCRPLVEWALRLMPAGGVVAERPTWTEADRQASADSFFASDIGLGLDDEEGSAVVALLWQFGLDVGPGDPLRWSPVNVEMLLTWWLPLQLAGRGMPPDKALMGLRAWIRWCHRRRALSAAQTADTLASVEHWAPAFRVLVESSADLAAAEARLAAMQDPFDDALVADLMIEAVDRATGGRAATLALTDDPLPDEPFDWSGVAEDVREQVTEVLALVDRCCNELFDVEHRTAARRVLARAAATDPRIFRRRSRVERTAAVVCWLVARANDSTSPYGPLTTQGLLEWFEVSGSVSQRAEAFLAALGINPYQRFTADLGSVDYLVSGYRRDLIDKRDRWLPEL